MTLFEVNEASSLITEEADEEAEIIFGSVIDETLKDEIRVTVIATGFNPVIQDEVLDKPEIRPEPKKEQMVEMPEARLEPNTPAPTVATEEAPSPDLKSARKLAREIGKRFFETEEYDIPTFLRRQND